MNRLRTIVERIRADDEASRPHTHAPLAGEAVTIRLPGGKRKGSGLCAVCRRPIVLQQDGSWKAESL